MIYDPWLCSSLGSWGNTDFLVFLEIFSCSSSIAQMSSWHLTYCVFILTVYNLLWKRPAFEIQWNAALQFTNLFSSLDLEKELSWSTQLICAKWLSKEAEMLKGERCHQAFPDLNWTLFRVSHRKSSRMLMTHLISTKALETWVFHWISPNAKRKAKTISEWHFML